MKIFYILICFSISFYYLRIFKKKILIKKQLDTYLSSLNKLKAVINNPDETKIILNKISISGIKLIADGLVFSIPYLFCFFVLVGLLKNYTFSIMISCLPYFFSYFYKK